MEKQVIEIFEAWRKIHDHPRAKLTLQLRGQIIARLNEGFTSREIIQAIHGCKSSKFHMGENESGAIYDSLSNICKNENKLRMFMSIYAKNNKDHQLEAKEFWTFDDVLKTFGIQMKSDVKNGMKFEDFDQKWRKRLSSKKIMGEVEKAYNYFKGEGKDERSESSEIKVP